MNAFNALFPRDSAETAVNDALVWALRGTFIAGERLEAEFSGMGDPDADLVSPRAMKRARRAKLRLAGLRDILVVGHPQVEALRIMIDEDRARIPQADPEVIERLAELEGFAFDGLIATINGVPIPAGARQTDYYMVCRYRPLYSPHALPHLVYCRDPAEVGAADHSALRVKKGEKPGLIHLVGYDARHVTDDAQLLLLRYSTDIHRANLFALQRSHPKLFVALWIRDMETAKAIARRCPQASLPESNPRSRVRSRAMRLLYGTSLMNEFERLFEILGTVRYKDGVTRQSINALRSTTAMTPVKLVNRATKDFVQGAVAHTRALHPSMNKIRVSTSGNPAADLAREALENNTAYTVKVKRIRWITNTMPALYFLGVEPEMLAAVALIQLIWNVEKHEHAYCMPGRNGRGGDDDWRSRLVIELATIITSGICVPTARGILRSDQKKGGGTDDGWLAAVPPTLIDNSSLREKIERIFEQQHELTGSLPLPVEEDDDHKHRSSPYERASFRATKCSPAINKPGWTQGFRFDAWLRPDAELDFLRNCCRYVLYDPVQAAKREAWNAALAPSAATDHPTGLPREHPCGRIQDMLRSVFDRLQVPELVRHKETPESLIWREAAIREVAALLVTVSPITLDPNLSERIIAPIDDKLVRLAVQGAWNT